MPWFKFGGDSKKSRKSSSSSNKNNNSNPSSPSNSPRPSSSRDSDLPTFSPSGNLTQSLATSIESIVEELGDEAFKPVILPPDFDEEPELKKKEKEMLEEEEEERRESQGSAVKMDVEEEEEEDRQKDSNKDSVEPRKGDGNEEEGEEEEGEGEGNENVEGREGEEGKGEAEEEELDIEDNEKRQQRSAGTRENSLLPSLKVEEEIWSKMEELDFAKSSSAVKVFRADNPQGRCEVLKIVTGMEIDEVRDLAFSLVYPGNGKAPKQTMLKSIDGMDVDDVTLLAVIPESKLLVDPGLFFVDQKAVEAVMQKQEAEKKQKDKDKDKDKDKERGKEKRRTRFSSIGKMFGKHKEKEVQRLFKWKAEALRSYAAEKEDEFDFEKGDIFLVDLSAVAEEGWLFAQHHGKVGIIPAHFVKIVKEPGPDGRIPEEMAISPSITSIAEMVEEEPPKRVLVQATCMYDFVGQGDELTFAKGDLLLVDGEQLSKGEEWAYAELNGTTGYAPTGYLKLGIVDIKAEEEQSKKVRVWIYAEAVYNYNAQKEDELSTKVGDIIFVDANEEEPDWRIGQMNGREGYIPSEYIKFVTKEEVKARASMKLAQIRQEKRALEEDIRKKKIKDAHALRAKKLRDAELDRKRKEAERKRLEEEAEAKKAELVKKALFSRKTLLAGSDDEKDDY